MGDTKLRGIIICKQSNLFNNQGISMITNEVLLNIAVCEHVLGMKYTGPSIYAKNWNNEILPFWNADTDGCLSILETVRNKFGYRAEIVAPWTRNAPWQVHMFSVIDGQKEIVETAETLSEAILRASLAVVGIVVDA